jgi:hypothetical protein
LRTNNVVVVLKPQDIVVVTKLLGFREYRPKIAQVAEDIVLSVSEVYASLRRLQSARLIHSTRLGNAPNLEAIKEFFVHGVKYAFPADRGQLTRGVATSYAAPPLNRLIAQGDDPPPVWPYARGKTRGMTFEPFYAKVPMAALKDARLYELLALIDAVRDGRARERNLAERELLKRLDG